MKKVLILAIILFLCAMPAFAGGGPSSGESVFQRISENISEIGASGTAPAAPKKRATRRAPGDSIFQKMGNSISGIELTPAVSRKPGAKSFFQVSSECIATIGEPSSVPAAKNTIFQKLKDGFPRLDESSARAKQLSLRSESISEESPAEK